MKKKVINEFNMYFIQVKWRAIRKHVLVFTKHVVTKPWRQYFFFENEICSYNCLLTWRWCSFSGFEIFDFCHCIVVKKRCLSDFLIHTGDVICKQKTYGCTIYFNSLMPVFMSYQHNWMKRCETNNFIS